MRVYLSDNIHITFYVYTHIEYIVRGLKNNIGVYMKIYTQFIISCIHVHTVIIAKALRLPVPLK